MKKIAWFYYNEGSNLNNSVVRGINNALICLMFIYPITTGKPFNITLSLYDLFAIIIISPILVELCAQVVLKHTIFNETESKERKRKERFICGYCAICTILSSCLMLSISIAIKALTDEDLQMMDGKVGFIVTILQIIPPVVFAFNIINIPSLFYPIMKDELQ